jgi:hypothetical protein
VDERRSAQRTPIDLALTCRMPARPQPATLRDVTHHGCRIEVPGAPIELGGTTLIEVPGAGKVTGSVVWTQGRTAGVRFERALGSHVAVALGLEQPKPPEPEPEPEASQPAGGILRHWFRRLAGVFS